jgi:hypothetical protein
VLWVPGWEHTSEEMNYGFVHKLSQLLIVLINYEPAGALKNTGFVTAYKHNLLLPNSHLNSYFKPQGRHKPTPQTTHLRLSLATSCLSLSVLTHCLHPYTFFCLPATSPFIPHSYVCLPATSHLQPLFLNLLAG